MKIIYMGTPDFAVLPLAEILDSKHEVLAVVTQPDKPVGRKAIITPCAVKVFAMEKGVKTLSYNKISVEGVNDLKQLNPDVIVTCAYGQILSREILDIAKYGVVNIHASLLPKYRGASPIQWAIINGDKETGVTIMKTNVGVDTGDIISQQSTVISQDETAGELFERLSKIGANLIVKTLNDIEMGRATYTPQDSERATKVGMINKSDAYIDFTMSATDICNRIRGFNPWPIAYTKLDGKLLKIYSAKPVEFSAKAGEVIYADTFKGIVVGTGSLAIEILQLQIEGSKKMSAKDFVLGRKITPGTVLGE